jgi:polyhydroxyalkanoate synthesis repressor PhaR
MPAPRVIKKYPNRRLYDTELSRYITLADVRNLVLDGVELKVVDSASQEDLTRAILLQIMFEEEAGGEPLFSAKMLSQIIRFYGGTVQGMFARYLEESLDLFARQQQEMREAFGSTTLEAMTRMAERHMQLWSDIQENIFRTSGLAANTSKEQEEEKGS